MRFLFFLFTLSGFSLAADSLDSNLAKIQKAWDSVNSYQADFHQTITSKRMGTKEDSMGTLMVVKPGKLRWESKTDNNIQILNGKRFINIHENPRRKTRTVDIYNDISKQVDVKALSFLAEKTQFKESYVVSVVSQDTEKIELKLIPKGKASASSGEAYIAEFEKKGYMLRALATDQGDSKVRIDFANTKTNVPLEEKLFDYKPDPKDVVQTN